MLYQKLEDQPETGKLSTLACLILHNICIAANNSLPPQLDVTTNPFTGEKRSRDDIRKLLQMRNYPMKRDSSHLAGAIRVALTKHLY